MTDTPFQPDRQPDLKAGIPLERIADGAMLAGQIDGEDEYVRRIVFEDVGSHHDDLCALRDDTDRRSHRGEGGFSRDVRQPDDVRSWQTQREHAIVRCVVRDQVRQSSQR